MSGRSCDALAPGLSVSSGALTERPEQGVPPLGHLCFWVWLAFTQSCLLHSRKMFS